METFEETALLPEIVKAVSDLGFQKPTPIQAKAIPHLINTDKDLIALAQTGTGKTAAFSLPILHQLDRSLKEVQAIILCPTRELALQIFRDMEKFTKYLRDIKVVAVYGGANIVTQIKDLRNGGQIVVGTPGRVVDLIGRKKLKLGKVRHLVLDEADEMLSMGFKEDLDTVLEATPEDRQTLLFSATMPKGVASITKRYMNKPEEIVAGERNAGAENVEHHYYLVNSRDRYLALKRLVDMNPSIYGIIFCRTRRETKEVADHLGQDGYSADALHGDLSQAQRDYVMNRFRKKRIQLLVATDVAARGIDVDDLTHVINYNLPDDLEAYTHRSGRTGRAGKSGKSLAIVQNRDLGRLRQIERQTGKSFERKLVPQGREICEKQLFQLVDKVEKVEIDKEQIESFLPAIYEKLSWLSREELIQHFVSMEFNRFLAYYKDAPDLNAKAKKSRDRRDDQDRRGRDRGRESFSDRRGRRNGVSFSRFFINVGSKNKLDARGLIGLVNDNTRGKAVKIGKIEILKKFSFFEIDSNYVKDIQNSFKGAKYKGESIMIELSEKKERPDVDQYKKKKVKKKTPYIGKRTKNKWRDRNH